MKLVYDLIKESINESGYSTYFQDMPLLQLQDITDLTFVFSSKEDAKTQVDIGNTATVYGEQEYLIYLVTDDLYYSESQDGSMTSILLKIYKKIVSKVPYTGTDTNGTHRVYTVSNPVTTFSGKDERGRRIAEITFKVFWRYNYG